MLNLQYLTSRLQWPTRFLTAAALLLLSGGTPPTDDVDWAYYLGDLASTQYADLNQINQENAHQLEVAWIYRSGDARADNRSQIQCNPLVISGTLYGTSPQLKLFALDAATGEARWSFDPFAGNAGDNHALGVNRGVVYWSHEDDQRILFTAGSRLYAVDAARGLPVASFGENGSVSLHMGLGPLGEDRFVLSNTPGVLYEDLLILGTRVSEDAGAAPGYIRAFNVRTGEIAWTFHTIPLPGEYGHETWPADAYERIGGANAWTGMAVDAERGVVYVPTGSAAFDFWGGNRKGANLFANTILALDARTGDRRWHYQVVHHDLWDRDLPAPPNLVTIERGGRRIDALAQITKSGHVFVLDRDLGQPLFPIVEQPYPESDLIGEETWPTQPLPLKPPPFSRQILREEDLTNISPEANAFVRERFSGLRSEGQFTPPSREGTVIFPGFDGGGEWGGAAYDSTTGLLYVNGNEMPWILTMVETGARAGSTETASVGEQLYVRHCVACHGVDRLGNAAAGYPAIADVSDRLQMDYVHGLLQTGVGVMPAFPQLSEVERDAIVNFLFNIEPDPDAEQMKIADPDVPYAHTGYHRFFDQNGYPAVKPPWGTLNAIDLNEGEIVWTVPLGEFPELTAQGIPQTGTENYGGPVVTSGGLIFIAASKDEYFRVFDKDTGEELFKYKLPAGGYATPATYMVNGKQYVVIAAGGGKMGTPSGDAYVAFALP